MKLLLDANISWRLTDKLKIHFDDLKGDYKGYFSVRVDLQYRLILSVEKDLMILTDMLIIEDLTNHYQ